MARTEPAAQRNLDGYGAPLIPWPRVRDRLAQGFTQPPGTGGPRRHTFWLATVNPDNSPHVMPLGVLWIDGWFYFTSGPGTRKSKNLARNPRCALTVASDLFDLVIEGEAARVTEQSKLKRLAEAFAGQGWKPTVRDGAFYAEYSAPSAGPPPWYVYEVSPATVYALGTAEPFGATRFTF